MNRTVLFFGIILLLALIAMGAYIWQNEQDKASLRDQMTQTAASPAVIASPLPTATATPSTYSAETDEQGTLTGSLSFPSEVIPEMRICAVNVTTEEEICTDENINDAQYQYGKGYILDVPAGDYQVYAKIPNDPYQAYYSEAVECGLTVACTDHSPITVSIQTGETITGVDPQDWYNRGPEASPES